MMQLHVLNHPDLQEADLFSPLLTAHLQNSALQVPLTFGKGKKKENVWVSEGGANTWPSVL